MLRTVRHRQQMGEHHLSHAHGAVGRHIGHHDAVLVGSIYIHHVIASSQHTDIFQPWQLFYLLPVQTNLVGEDDLGIFRPFHGLFWPCTVIDRQFAYLLQLFPRQVARIGRIAVKYYNLHVFCYSLNSSSVISCSISYQFGGKITKNNPQADGISRKKTGSDFF